MKTKTKAKTPYRIYRFFHGGWVATAVDRRVNPWAPHSEEVIDPSSKDWVGRPRTETMIHGRTPFEALERLKKALGERA